MPKELSSFMLLARFKILGLDVSTSTVHLCTYCAELYHGYLRIHSVSVMIMMGLAAREINDEITVWLYVRHVDRREGKESER
jgi:hypothetical protein